MRILVCGGRNYNNVDFFYGAMAGIWMDYGKPEVIISGHAKGADSLAEMWADERGITLEIYPADWNQYGKRAGYLRNIQMLEEGKPDLVVAFPGGKGTAMMVRLAKEAGVPVKEVMPYTGYNA